MSPDASPSVDGRRARRERSRAAVIDSVFALVTDGKVPPSIEQVAERSGVSVSSIFRMFDGVDDMRDQALEQFAVRYAHLLELDVDASASRSDRLNRLVRARIELYSAAGPLMAMARQRALDYERFADSVSAQHLLLAEQTQRCLRPETSMLTPAEAANLAALIDATTSPEAFDVLGAAHARTRRQVEQTWRRAVAALVATWCDTTDASSTTTTQTTREPM
jgi:TetR/AcrR family transcriptional regulator of autoinduction and epiphytic fitness